MCKWQLHLNSAAACFHHQPATPSSPPTLLLLNNSDTEKFPFKMLLAYMYPSCIMIFCIMSSSAFGSFLIHRKREQDGKVCMKYPSLCGRKHRQLSQAVLTNSPNTAKHPAPPLLQLQVFPVQPSTTTRVYNQPLWKSPTSRSCSLEIPG